MLEVRLTVTDILIAEDDPYHFMQYRDSLAPSEITAVTGGSVESGAMSFVDSLVPSFLRQVTSK